MSLVDRSISRGTSYIYVNPWSKLQITTDHDREKKSSLNSKKNKFSIVYKYIYIKLLLALNQLKRRRTQISNHAS